MPRLLQSLQGIYAWLEAILIILDCSLLLASNLINYGARLWHHFYLYHGQVNSWPLSWFIIFPVIQQHLVSRLHCNLITPLWSVWFSDWHWWSGSCHFGTEHLILIPELLLLIELPLFMVWWETCCSLRSARMTFWTVVDLNKLVLQLIL